MKEQTELITIVDFVHELGYTKSTFYRRLKRLGIKPPGKILSPADQNYYRREMGHLPKFPELPPPVTLQILTNETKWNCVRLAGKKWENMGLAACLVGVTFVSGSARHKMCLASRRDRSFFPHFFTKIFYAT